MYILIKKNKIPFYFYAPLSVIKLKWISNAIIKKIDDEEKSQIILKSTNDLYRFLKKYIKENGHFYLLNIIIKEKKLRIRIKV